MRNYIKSILGLTIAIILFTGCQSGTKTSADLPPGFHQVIVKEVIQGSSYTYLEVKEDGKEYWMAIESTPVEEGGTYYFAGGFEMKNFESKELQRIFESILFVDQFSQDPPNADMPSMMDFAHDKASAVDQLDLTIEPAEGGMTIGQLYAARQDHAGKKVMIRGHVTKVNKGILGKNWAHIQDGTSDNGNYDLTVTTLEEVNIGDVVVFEGVITLEKDFGAGYYYDVIMEDAVRNDGPVR